MALSSGLRYMLDAIPAGATDKAHDLDSARDRFIEAQSAARSSLQQAIAERYLLLCLLGLQRTERAKDALTRLEGLAMTAALEAMILTEFNHEKAMALMQREGSSGRHLRLGDRSRLREAKLHVKSAALDRICMCGRLLGEAAMFASAFGLPLRASPPAEAINDSSLIEEPHNAIGGGIAIPPRPRVPDKGYWTFTVRAGETLCIGPLTVQILPGPAQRAQPGPSAGMLAAHHFAASRLFRQPPDLTRQHVRLDVDCQLPEVRVEVSAAGRQLPHMGLSIDDDDSAMRLKGGLAWNETDFPFRNTLLPLEESRDWSAKYLRYRQTWVELSIPPAKSDSSELMLTITPHSVFRNLIEVSCIPLSLIHI